MTPAGSHWEGAPRHRRAPWPLLVLLAVLLVGITARLAFVADGGLLEVGGRRTPGVPTEPGAAASPGPAAAQDPAPEPGAPQASAPGAPTADGTWIGVPDPPVAWVRPPRLVWTGRVVLAWGPSLDGAAGAAFDPVARTWRVLPDGPLGARDGHVAVWAGGPGDLSGAGEMIVWGGRPLLEDPREAPGGAAYDPLANRWRLIAEGPIAARGGAHATWTGTRLLVAPGAGAGSSDVPAAAYDPVEDAWEALPPLPPGTWLDGLAWTGSETLALLGQPGRQALVPVAAWEPDLGLWLPRPAAPLGVASSVLTLTTDAGPVLWVRTPDGAGRLVLLDPDTDRWALTDVAPLADRTAPSLVWTGRHVIVWGGADVRGLLADGALYDTVDERWRRIGGGAVEVARPLAAVWAGSEMIVVGYRGRDRQAVAAMGWAPAGASR